MRVPEAHYARTRCWGMRVGGGLRGGLEPWRWLPDVTGLSGNRLGAELPEAAAKAAAVAAAARLGLLAPSLRAFCSRHCSRAAGAPSLQSAGGSR
jgi:hypothetical protein